MRYWLCADFDEFVIRDRRGGVLFASRQYRAGKRHRDRVWPALSRYKRIREKRVWQSAKNARDTRLLEWTSLLTVLRKWAPENPLFVRHGTICDLAQRPPRYDDFRWQWSTRPR